MSFPPGRSALVVAVLIIGLALALLSLRQVPRGATESRPASRPVSAAAPSAPPVFASEAPAYSPLAEELHASRFDAAHDLDVLRGLIGQFVTTLRLAERPPLGDNADVTAALTGRNRRRVVFIPPDHPAVRDGLLMDREGTPYHFHARSADAIDVRSAGPDHVLFTADDLVSPRPKPETRP